MHVGQKGFLWPLLKKQASETINLSSTHITLFITLLTGYTALSFLYFPSFHLHSLSQFNLVKWIDPLVQLSGKTFKKTPKCPRTKEGHSKMWCSPPCIHTCMKTLIWNMEFGRNQTVFHTQEQKSRIGVACRWTGQLRCSTLLIKTAVHQCEWSYIRL